MVMMLVFMFVWSDHESAPQIGHIISVENLVMFLLATPVQVRRKEFFAMCS